MSTIVTHLNPDLDAITSVWLLQRFMPGFSDAEVKFVPAGLKSAVSNSPLAISSNENNNASAKSQQPTANSQFANSQFANSQSLIANSVLWVDTGFGELDHHQGNVKTCAAVLTLAYIKNRLDNYSSNQVSLGEKFSKDSSLPTLSESNNMAAVERLVNVVLRIDYFAEDITMPHASDDFFALMFNERQILRGYRSLYRGQSDKHLEFGMQILDAVYETIKMKIEAEKIIENGIKFETKWGKGVGAETGNEMYMHLAQELGFLVVVSKDPKRGHLRIHAKPGCGINFSREYEIFQKMDPLATWYLHPSLSLLLNGSSANPDMRPTKLGLKEIIEVLEKE